MFLPGYPQCSPPDIYSFSPDIPGCPQFYSQDVPSVFPQTSQMSPVFFHGHPGFFPWMSPDMPTVLPQTSLVFFPGHPQTCLLFCPECLQGFSPDVHGLAHVLLWTSPRGFLWMSPDMPSVFPQTSQGFSMNIPRHAQYFALDI